MTKKNSYDRNETIGRSPFFNPKHAEQGSAYPSAKDARGLVKVVGVNYGHTKGGKVYNYLAPASARVGQTITPPVEHSKSKKLYRTLGRIVSTSTNVNQYDSALSKKGLSLKQIGATKQSNLSGYYTNWGKDAKIGYDLINDERLNGTAKSLYEAENIVKQVKQENKDMYEQKLRQKVLSKVW